MRRKGLKAKSVCGRNGIKDAADLTSSAWLSIRVNRDKNGYKQKSRCDAVLNLKLLSQVVDMSWNHCREPFSKACSIQRQRICIEQIQGNQNLILCTNAYGFSFQIG
ncbi:hypothetical protein D5086_019689 [Populus alba]|uniref:Uncharacterized protein n=1 Tax=Populus alba TaxID=43335 RepID=A0ACC4BIH4_POPAL